MKSSKARLFALLTLAFAVQFACLHYRPLAKFERLSLGKISNVNKNAEYLHHLNLCKNNQQDDLSSNNFPVHVHHHEILTYSRPITVLVMSILSNQVLSSASAIDTEVVQSISTSQDPIITHKVYLDIKIANYTEESIGNNRGAAGSGRVVFGLYGKDAPKSVDIFLQTIKSDGETFPSYINSQFSRITDEGLLQIEKIRGLNTVILAGSDQFEYAGEVMPYEPILESNGIRHSRLAVLLRRDKLTL